MSDLSKEEVLRALASAQFAEALFLYLDVLVTIDLGAMGLAEPEDARGELQRFLKAMGSWLNERALPVVWIACIERAKAGNLHAHIAVHVPGMRREGDQLHGTRYRTLFRRWAREAVQRRVGKKVPGLVNVRCSLEPSLIAHWICVTYLLKGYDRAAILYDSAGEGLPVFLGDILPFPYRHAGDVGHDRRLFISGNLGPARRQIGMPAGFEFMLPNAPDINGLQLVPGAGDGVGANTSRIWKPQPFRAAVEDGRFDVRQIYGVEFAAFVTREREIAPATTQGSPELAIAGLLMILNDLGV
jgi:hypothetical protein